MEYFSRHAILPQDNSLINLIEQAAEKLCKKLLILDLKSLGVSEYNQRYLGDYLLNIRGILQINTYILSWALANSNVPLEEHILIDYGGGCGLLSLLAKETGIRHVIYNDIYDISCRDARLIGKAIDRAANDYICGDIDVLINYLNNNSIKINSIVSMDVIEHIYKIDEYFRKLKHLPAKSLTVALASGANRNNAYINYRLKKSHRKIENAGIEKPWGSKEIDLFSSYLSARQNIIKSFDSTLTQKETEIIAKKTRGLIKPDIEACVLEYRKTGTISYHPDHPTNTCDPYTGNWNEHLMNTTHIKKLFKQEGFDVQIKSGYYFYDSNKIKRIIKNILNLLIILLKARNLNLSPFYMIYAKYNH